MDEISTEIDLQIADHGIAVYPPGWTLGPRRMTAYEFVWILEGDVEWTRDGHTRPLQAGDVLLVQPTGEDFFQWDPHRTTRHCFVSFFLPQGPVGLPDPETWPLIRTMPPDDLIRPLFRLVLTPPRPAVAGWDARRTESARILLWSFVHDVFDLGSLGSARLNAVVERVLTFLREQWASPPLRPLTLAELADVAAVSPTHLCRVFTAQLGHGPVDVVRVLRIYWSAMALAWTDLPTAEVAAQAGFADLFHFSRRFRDVYGMPPATFRRRHAAGTAHPHEVDAGTALAASRVWGARQI